MAEFIQNPRRSPRAPARCGTTVVSAHGSFEATTEDIGGHGCQLVSPRLVRRGEPVQLVLAHESVKEPLRISGRVAWVSDRAPWRLGIAYDEAALEDSKAWFDEVLSRAPGLKAFRRIPDRIPFDAVVYLAAPPRFLVDFTPDEVALLRALGSGTSVAEIRALLRDRWPEVQRALFSLLAHQHVTLSRGGSVHPDAWRKILSEAESSLAVEALRTSPVPDLTPPPAPLRTAPSPASPQAPPPVAPGVPARPNFASFAAASPMAPPAPVDLRGAPPEPPSAQGGPTVAAPVGPSPEPTAPAAGEPEPEPPADWLVTAAEMMPVTWPSPAQEPALPPRPRGLDPGPGEGTNSQGTPPPLTGGAQRRSPARTPEAQGCFERALAELEAGRNAGALALLRRTLALAPGDPEVAAVMARIMKAK
ncbi:MAG TPA: PilZ domain-containing protein [Anaeromyxobacter sp.]|nr:PilZ domain-containing protein [Anaeromyxobacter sp.]